MFGRHTASIRTITGVYRNEVGESPNVAHARRVVEEFAEHQGRRPRILVAKMGQDGHDRGQKVIATAFADLGFDVDVGPLFQTPEEVARQAAESDVHVVGVSTLAAGPPDARAGAAQALADIGRPDIMIVVGGVIPPQDFDALRAAGAAAIFPPGTVIADAAVELLGELERQIVELARRAGDRCPGGDRVGPDDRCRVVAEGHPDDDQRRAAGRPRRSPSAAGRRSSSHGRRRRSGRSPASNPAPCSSGRRARWA